MAAVQVSAGFPLDEALAMIPPLTRKAFKKYPHLNRLMDTGDFESEVALHMISKEYLQKFNPSITNKPYFMWVMINRKAIDFLRKDQRTVDTIATEVTVDGEEKLSLLEVIADPNADDPVSELIVREALSVLESEGKFETVEVPNEGPYKLSEYSVFYLFLKGYQREEIANWFKVTSSTISNYIKRSQTKLREWYEGKSE